MSELPARLSPGQRLSAHWLNRLLDFLRARELRPGPGIKLTRTPSGTVVSLAATTRRSSRLAGDAVIGVVQGGATGNLANRNDFMLVRIYPNWPDMSGYTTARLYAPCVFRRAPLMAGDTVVCHPCAVGVTTAGEDS